MALPSRSVSVHGALRSVSVGVKRSTPGRRTAPGPSPAGGCLRRLERPPVSVGSVSACGAWSPGAPVSQCWVGVGVRHLEPWSPGQPVLSRCRCAAPEPWSPGDPVSPMAGREPAEPLSCCRACWSCPSCPGTTERTRGTVCRRSWVGTYSFSEWFHLSKR